MPSALRPLNVIAGACALGAVMALGLFVDELGRHNALARDRVLAAASGAMPYDEARSTLACARQAARTSLTIAEDCVRSEIAFLARLEPLWKASAASDRVECSGYGGEFQGAALGYACLARRARS